MRIAAEGIRHQFTGDADKIFDGLHYEFLPGTQTVISGPSGAGKSTLLYMLALLLTPQDGRIVWGEESVGNLQDSQRSQLRAAHAGFVFQDAILDLSKTAFDNVMEAAWFAGVRPAEAKRRARSLLEQFGLERRSHHVPGEVSGGQAQRIALCRALVKRPSVVFADEPTGNLDADTAQIVWDSLTQAASDGVTVIIATHDPVKVSQADSLLRLS